VNCGPRNAHCWRAIFDVINQWTPRIRRATLEAHFDEDILTLIYKEPGLEPCSATVNIEWIAYADQAERLAILTRMALVDIEMLALSQRDKNPRNKSLQHLSN
jgi:hypothetical protein